MNQHASHSSPPITGVWRNPIVLLATGLGVGAARFAPGTLGTMWGLPITLALASVESWWSRVALILALCLTGVTICGRAADLLGKKDPGAVVWDEFVTLPIVFLWVPLSCWRSPLVLAVGFVLHRIFDVSKVPPVNYAERLPAGWGIMLDDVVAAIYASVLLWGLNYLGWFTPVPA